MAVDTSLHQLTPIFVYDKVAVHPLLMGTFGATVYVPPTPEVHVAVTPKPMYVRAWKPESSSYKILLDDNTYVFVSTTPGKSYWPDGSGEYILLDYMDLLAVVQSALASYTGFTWALTIDSSGLVSVTSSTSTTLDFSALDGTFPCEMLGFVPGTKYALTGGVPTVSPNPSSLVWAPNRPWQRDTGDLSKPVGASVQTVGGASRGYMLAQTAERTITHTGLSMASVTGTWGLSDQLGYWKEAPVRIYPDQGDPDVYSTYTLISGDPSLSSTLLPRYDAELRFVTYTPPFTSDYALDTTYLDIGGIRTLDGLVWSGARWTISLWVRASTSSDGPIVGRGTPTDCCFQLRKIGSALRVEVADSATTLATWTSAADSIPVGSWVHFVVSFDGRESTTSKLRVWRNGSLVTSGGTFGSWTGVSSSVRDTAGGYGILVVGRPACSGSGSFPGYVDDIAYWAQSCATSTSASSAMYAGGIPADMRIATGGISPTNYWRFEGDLGDSMRANHMAHMGGSYSHPRRT